MSDREASNDPAQQTPSRHVLIQAVYCRDVSYESPGGPQPFVGGSRWEPHIKLQVDINSARSEAGTEVVLGITLTATQDERTACLIEVKQAGLFGLRGFAEDEERQVILTYCPSVLLPYARQVISDLMGKGGFPPYLLPPINFEALYHQRQGRDEDAARFEFSAGPARGDR